MRQIIAMEVASDHETYNEGVLGRPNAEYCAWIQQPSSWGGAIEVIEKCSKKDCQPDSLYVLKSVNGFY